MPISRRSVRRAARERCTGRPSKRISPLSGTSSPLIQRSSVVLPEPLRPMMATTSPLSIVSDTSSSATWVTKRLQIPFNAKIGIDAPFKTSTEQRKRPAHSEIQCRYDRIDDHGLKRHVDDKLPRAGQFDEANDGGNGGAFD